MFLVWCLINGLGGELQLDELYIEVLAALKQRKLTPGAFVIEACDEKFMSEMVSEEGNLFTKAYFESETGKYLADYETTLGRPHATLYHVPDTWETYDKLAPIIARRFQNWKKYGTVEEPAKPRWKFW